MARTAASAILRVDFVSTAGSPVPPTLRSHAPGIDRRSDGVKDFQGAGDAIHIASALVWNIHQVHTWDGSHMLPWHMMLDCRDGTKLSIVKPVVPPAGPLFAGTQGQP